MISLALIKININILIAEGAINKSWCLISSSDLKHRMSVRLFNFTFFTEIEVTANTTLVSDASNWVGIATVTSYTGMNLGLLVGSSFSKIINKQSLESLSGVRLNFFLKDLD